MFGCEASRPGSFAKMKWKEDRQRRNAAAVIVCPLREERLPMNKDGEMMQIHRYRNNGYNMVLDVPGGSVHVVDDLMYDMIGLVGEDADGDPKEAFLAMHPEADAAEAEELLSEIDELRRDGALFSEEPYAPSIEAYQKRPTVVKALCLHVAHDCNLACRYCFAEEGEYHGRRAIMSLETGKKALRYLAEHSGTRRNLEVDFFGGEPLLNFDVVKELVAYGREIEKQSDKHFRFTITTNGVLLNDEVMEFCNREMDNVVLSIDGRKEVNDRMRPFRSGAGSYDLILPKFQKFAAQRRELGLKYYVRGTFTHWNLDFAADVLHLADCGFDQISVEPVVAPPEADYAIRPEDVPVIEEQYQILAEEMVRREKEGKGFNFFHFMIDLTGGPCVYKRLSGCGSGSEYLAVTPWGDFYPCHQFVGMEDFLLGNVDDGIRAEETVREFKGVNVYSKKECASCFARFYCSGGCMANSWNFTGSVNGVYEIGCRLERKRVECALMIKAALA